MSILLDFFHLMTLEMWISAVVSFFLGFLLKVLMNIFLTPNVVINKDILLDIRTNEPYIKIANQSRRKWNTAYDIQIYLTYSKYDINSQKYIPMHTGFIKDGKLAKDDSVKYLVYPQNGFDDTLKNTYKLEVTFFCKNRFGTYLIVDQECAFDMSCVKNRS